VKSPYELKLNYIRNLAEELEGRYEPEELKWIAEGSGGGNYHVLIIAAVTELPLIDSLNMPEHIETNNLEKHEETINNVLSENVLGEKDVLTEEEPRQALIGLHFMDNEENNTLPGVPSADDEMTLPGVMENEKESTEEELPGLSAWNMEEPSEGIEEVAVEESVNRADTVEQDLDDVLEEIAAELTGFPLPQKKGQKKLDEYDDDLGIDFI